MTSEEKMKCAVHCMKSQAGIEVCEECDAFLMDSSTCEDIAREAYKALEEVQEYRRLGTIAKVEELVEKDKPKKPDYEGDGYADGQLVYDTWICPNCGTEYEVDYDDYEHCPKCGQRLEMDEE